MSNVFVFRQLPPGVINEYFGGGGKGGTSTSSVSIPPEVLARYNAVNARAETTAEQPFQQYGGEFVAPLTPTQTAGIQGTNAAAGQAQPYYGAATALTLGGAKNVGPLTQGQIGYYQNPYTQAVVNPTVQALQQQQGQQLAEQQTQAIKGGAFGGQRAGLQRAQLQGQQNLALGQAIAPLYQQGYGQAVQTAAGQQGVVASDLARQMQAGQQIAGLGTGAQQAALQGSQAQLAAGQIGQQTQQAQDTAQYQQFLQERGYPFQVSQFLANIAMGTGALSGSTTTSTQPGGFFSDKRLKDDVREIGETHDGQPIYSYKYKGDDRTQIGLMAQDVEKRHPEAVGLMGGYKTVDYKKATEDAERTHKDMGGGLMPDGFDPNSMGGAVSPDMAGEGFERGGYVGGGLVGNDDWSQIVAANKQALGVYGGAQPMGGGAPGATGIVPAASVPVPKLVTASPPSQQRSSGLSSAMQTGKDIAGAYKMGKEGLIGSPKTTADPEGASGLIGGQGEWGGKNVFSKFKDLFAEGGLVPRHAYADGGSDDDSQGDEAVPYDPSDVMGSKDPMEGVLKAGSQKHEMLKPANTGSGGGGRGSSLGLGKMAGSALGSAFGPFGSMAGGFLGGLLPFAEGGVVPRQGYYEGGPTDKIPADYSPEADMPSSNAQEAGLVVERPVEAQPDWRIAADEAAKRAGIDPRNFARVIHAESGFKPHAVGDENSSAGLLQMHIAGASGKYPNSGLGDAYLSAKNPELAKTGTPEQKIAYLKDPANQADILDYGAQHIANKGYGAWTTARQMGLVPGSEAPRPPGLVGAGMQPAAPSGEGKKSIGDVVTSEGFIVPALGFLGSMLASNRPNLGQALGEGIMGGVGAYQGQRKMAAEIPKIEAQTKLELANVGRVDMMTRSLRAGMLIPTWQPGVGLVVIDKENPYAGMTPVTDADGKPLPGNEKLVEEMQKTGSIPAGGPGATAKPGAAPTATGTKINDITKVIEKPSDANSWTPTTSVPKNYIPANQANITMKDPSTGKMTESAQAALDTGKTTVSGLEQQALRTGPAMVQLQQIIQEYNSLPQSGFLAPGAGAARRNELVASANAALRAIGAQPIDPNAAGSAEAIQKGTFNLGAGVANSIGTREPGYIVQQAVKNSPGIEMSKKGFDLVSSGLTQNGEYANDRAKFFRDYLSKFQHLDGAQEAFDHANPPQMYADRAMLNTIPEADRQYLRNYVAQNPTKKVDAMRRFEKDHGVGTAKIVLGR